MTYIVLKAPLNSNQPTLGFLMYLSGQTDKHTDCNTLEVWTPGGGCSKSYEYDTMVIPLSCGSFV